MLAFFPWLKLKKDSEELDLEKAKLIGFLRGKLPGKGKADTQNICDRIFEPYISSIIKSTQEPTVKLEPIEESTILLLKDKEIFQDFSEAEKNFLFSIAKIIAFSGISTREYFSGSLGFYCNRGDFTFVIQEFKEGAGAYTIETRRRNGTNKIYIPSEVFQEIKPRYVNQGFFPVKLDITLIKSLLNAQEKLKDKEWSSYADAIFHFNHANTDNDQIAPHQEIVLIVSAFERILDCKSGKQGEVVKKFLTIFNLKENLDIAKSIRIQDSKYKNTNKTLREIWMRDLYQLRSEYAHGKKSNPRPHIWKAHEHLLLGSYVLPLVVKLKLREYEFYQLTQEDILDINTFERLADADLSTNLKEWNDIRLDCWFKLKLENAARESKDTDDADTNEQKL